MCTVNSAEIHRARQPDQIRDKQDAAALLARQALEAAMADLWAANCQAAGLYASTMRSQELCLTAYLDPGPARRATYLFAALSRACHYHPYELAPTAAELTGWLDQAAQLITQIQAASTAPAPPGPLKSLRGVLPDDQGGGALLRPEHRDSQPAGTRAPRR